MKKWVLISVLTLTLIVIAQNSEVVTVRFLGWDASISRIVLLLGTFIAGIIVGFVAAKLPKRRPKASP